MKITRTMPEAGWVPVANSAARDHRLSWRARGLLAELLSYPDGWETSIDKLVTIARKAEGGSEGRDAMRNAMGELIALGYVQRVHGHDRDGRWVTKLAISDAPTVPKNPAPDNPTPAEPASVDQAFLQTRTTNTYLKKTEDQYSGSLTTFAVSDGDASLMTTREELLNTVYEHIGRLNVRQRHQNLLTVEKRRPRIYREARRNALRQLGEQDRDVAKTDAGAAAVDELSYKYIAQHYIVTAGELPVWLARPMGWR